jgi:hypothetical protein
VCVESRIRDATQKKEELNVQIEAAQTGLRFLKEEAQVRGSNDMHHID